ncbi:MAG: 30S ribosomal protein S6 [Bacteroidetes bacterium]|nr:30S ribosomal protein S6 [Bacteroidota bacterium]
MNMKHYETTIIINGALEEEPIMQVVSRTSDFIARNGGEIKNADHWGRRRLAYPINKKNNGYYVQFQVDGPGELIHQLERFYQLEEHIIRYLTLQLDDKDIQSRDEMRQRLLAEAESAEEAAAASENGETAVGKDDSAR